jgi:DNA segregation ATPase FtsK/SpoIIIE-like protein
MEASNASLRDRGIRKVEPGDPLHVVVCDELTYFLDSESIKQSRQFISVLRDLCARGRAAGLIVVMATQKPGSDVLPTSIRDLTATRIALRTMTTPHSDMVLGDGQAANGFDATTIPGGQPGGGYLLSEGEHPVRFRAYFADPEDVAVLQDRFAGLKPTPTASTTSAAGSPQTETPGTETGETAAPYVVGGAGASAVSGFRGSRQGWFLRRPSCRRHRTATTPRTRTATASLA